MNYLQEIKKAHATNWRNSLPVTKPGRWTAHNNYLFYLFQAEQTEFDNNDQLILNHFYFNEREVSIIEEFENMAINGEAKQGKLLINHCTVVNCLTYENNFNIERATDDMYDILRIIQMATGNVYTVRQLNNKHINMRSRIATPFISLHDSGYFYKNPLKIPPKLSVKDVIKLSLASTNIEFMSNLDAKFFNLIKTMYKFNAHKHLFWNSQTNTHVDYSEIEKKPLVENDFTESDRWVHAMIATHGQKMVRYMEVCLLNLLNTYITINIDSQKLESEADKFINLYDQEKRHRIFNVIIDELVEMGMQRPTPFNIVFSPENKMELLIGKKRVLEYIDSPDETHKRVALDYLFDDSLLNNDRLLLGPVVNQKTEKNSASSSDSSNISISSSSDFTLDMFMNSVLDIDWLNNMPLTDASNTISSLVPMKQSSSEISSSNSELNNHTVPAVSYTNNFLNMELGGQQLLGTQNSISVGSVTKTWDGYPVCLARPDDDGSAWLNSLFAEQSKSSFSINKISNNSLG